MQWTFSATIRELQFLLVGLFVGCIAGAHWGLEFARVAVMVLSLLLGLTIVARMIHSR